MKQHRLKEGFSTLLTLLLLTVSSLGWAQTYPSNIPPHPAYLPEDTAVVHHVGWVRYNLLDQWMVSAQGGGLLYYGTEDRLGPFADRLTGDVELQVGRWIFPMLGLRISGGYAHASGFLSHDTYDAYRNTILSADHNGEGGLSGTNEQGTLLGGYYWPYNNNLYQQRWRYHYFGLDIVFNMAMLRSTQRYNPERHWNNLLYAGMASRWAHSELEGYSNHKSEAHVGYMGVYRINNHWSIYADARLAYVERTFDREWVGGLERATGFGSHGDLNASLQAGVCYRFNLRRQAERRHFSYNTPTDDLLKAAARNYVYYERYADILQTQTIDSVITHITDSTAIIEARHILDSLVNDKPIADNQTLDSILLKRLLPYEMVFFDLDRYVIRRSEESKIAKMAFIMLAYPDEHFVLYGAADAQTGTPSHNQWLSEHRVKAVYDKLINEYGVNPKQLETKALGGIDTYEPFQLNRTTIIIMQHPTVQKAFEEMQRKRTAGSGTVIID